MRIAHRCIGCDSPDLRSRPGQFAPFVAHRFGAYEPDRDPFLLPTLAHACNACGLVFAALRPDAGAMARIYQGYRGATYNQIRSRLEPSYAAIATSVGAHPVERVSRNRVLGRFLSETLGGPAGRVLDYGGDRGQFIPSGIGATERAVFEVSGAEPEEGITAYDSLADCPSRYYDLILCQHVLEHVPYPLEVLGAMRSRVRAGGAMVVVVPLERPGGVYRDDTFQTWFHEHITLFDEGSLRACLEKGADGRVVRIQTEMIDYGWIQAATTTALVRVL